MSLGHVIEDSQGAFVRVVGDSLGSFAFVGNHHKIVGVADCLGLRNEDLKDFVGLAVRTFDRSWDWCLMGLVDIFVVFEYQIDFDDSIGSFVVAFVEYCRFAVVVGY